MSGPERGEGGRDALDARVLAWMREPEPADDEARFAELALALFAHQFAHCPPYRRFCEGRGRTPGTVADWREIPAVPTGAFKELALRSFPAERTRHVFRTSGTTGGARGALHLDTLALYETSVVPPFERFVLPELLGTPRCARLLVLAPPPEEAPDSSLSHMFGVLLARRGDARSGFFVRDGALEAERLGRAVEDAAADGDAILALCGTAFAFVHWLEHLAAAGARLRLPHTARVMETGGFKGRARARPREALYAELETRLDVPPARVVNQYGMTELGSQFHDSVLARPAEARRKLGPPWARARVLDPASGEDVPPGAPGMIQIVDLANTGSVIAVATADLGRPVADGFQVEGRAPGAEARGCSIAADEMLGG